MGSQTLGAGAIAPGGILSRLPQQLFFGIFLRD